MSCTTSLAVNVHDIADSLHIPLSSLEGIWKKAAELLKTEGAIVLLQVLVTMPSLFLTTVDANPIWWFQRKVVCSLVTKTVPIGVL